MKMKIAVAALALLAQLSGARAQTPGFYVLKDASSPQNTLQMGVWNLGGNTYPDSVSSDSSGNPLSGAIGSTNTNGTALFVQGVTGGVPLPTVLTGTLPAFASIPTVNLGSLNGAATAALQSSILSALGHPLQAGGSVSIGSPLPSFASVQHFICDSGCSAGSGGGTSSNFNSAFPAAGTAIGVFNGSAMLPLTLGQAVSSASIPVVLPAAQITALTPPTTVAVTGTFWQTTQPVSAASLPLPAGAATQTTSAAILSALGSPMQNSGGSVTANAGTNLNTSALALESGGHLASIDTKTPALGQALAAASTPVVLTAAQLTTLTPPAAITGFALDTSVGTTNTDIGPPGATACATDNGSCSLNALIQRNNQRITSLITALGTPFQAGASIGNTAFGISGTLPAFAATPTVNLGTIGGAATQTTLASILTALGSPFQAAGSIGNTAFGISGTLPAFAATPTFNLGTLNGAATASNQTGGTQKTQIVDGSGNVIASTSNALNVAITSGGGSGGTSSTFGSAFPTTGTAVGMSQGGNMVALSGTSGNLNVQCANCSGSGVSTADGATFTAGSSLFAGSGGIVQTTATSNPVTAGDQGLFQMTANRALFTNLRNASGTEIGTSSNPVQVSLANTGSNATAVSVAGTGTAGTPGTAVLAVQGVSGGTAVPVSGSVSITGAVALNATPSLANGNGVVPTIAGAVLSATNGDYSNLLQGNAVLSATNGLFVTPTTSASFTVAQATPSSLNATVVGTGTFAVQASIASAASWGINTLGSTTSGQSGQLALGAVTTGSPTYTTAQSNALSLTTAGALRVDGSAVTQPVSISGNQSVNVAQINGTTTDTGSGTLSAGTQRIALATNSPGIIALGQAASASSVPVVLSTGQSFSGQNAATPSNIIAVGAQFNTTPTTITSGNVSALQLDSAGNLLVNVKTGGGSGGTSSSFAATFPGTGTAVGMSQGGNMVAMTGTSGNLNVQCANCSGSGASAIDEATFTAGTSVFAPAGGFFQTTATSNPLTNGQQGMAQMTANRAVFENLRNSSGAEIGISSAEVFVGGRGTAGTAAGGVLTVQGVASMTPVQVSQATAASLNATVVGTGTFATQSAITAASGAIASGAVSAGAVAAGAYVSGSILSGALASGAVVDITNMQTPVSPNTATATKGLLIGGQFNTTQETLTNGQQGQVALSARGAVMVATGADTFNVTVSAALPAGTNLMGKVGIDQTTVGTTNGVSLAQIGANTVSTGAGATGTGTQRVGVAQDTTTLAGSAPGTAGSASANVVTVQGVASMTPVAGNITQVLGSAISATNGLFSNLLQANAVLSATNPIFSSITDGTNKAAVKAASTAPVATDPALVVGLSPNGNQATAANQVSPNTASVTEPTSTLALPSTTTAYAAGSLMCTSATVATCNTALSSQTIAIANSAGAMDVERVEVSINDNVATGWNSTQIQIDFWSAAPTFQTTGDRGIFLTDFLTGAGVHLGAFICNLSGTANAASDGVFAECFPTVGVRMKRKLASGTSVFWTATVVNGTGVVTASKTLTIKVPLTN